ncbi:MAG: 30S ribosomal protein S17 [Candidatus Altiarchaeota archaeon]|nr:30S ribosomal protein S17 [Candidatus Altiarchaeota archaeon]
MAKTGVKAKAKNKDAVECSDRNCPVHGSLSTRGIVLEGVVASDKMDKTAIVQKSYYIKLRKYERYRPKKSRIPAHNPPCISAKTGDKVRIMECRKLSKTVNFVITEKLDSNKKEGK